MFEWKLKLSGIYSNNTNPSVTKIFGLICIPFTHSTNYTCLTIPTTFPCVIFNRVHEVFFISQPCFVPIHTLFFSILSDLGKFSTQFLLLASEHVIYSNDDVDMKINRFKNGYLAKLLRFQLTL